MKIALSFIFSLFLAFSFDAHATKTSAYASPSEMKEKGKIIVVYGGSSVGKTTIIKALKEKLGDQAIYDAVDEVFFRVTLPNFKTTEPILYQDLSKVMKDEDIATAIFTKRYKFKENVTDQEKEAAKKRLDAYTADWMAIRAKLSIDKEEKAIFERAISEAEKGKTFVLELTDLDAFHGALPKKEHPLFNQVFQVKYYFLYLPVRSLSKRLNERNQKAFQDGNPREERIGSYPFNQLAALVRPKKTEDKISLGKVSKTDLIEFFNVHHDIEMREFPLEGATEAQLKDKKKTLLNQLLKDFYLENVETVEITPKHNVDLAIHMEKVTTEEAANLILEDIKAG